MNDERGDTQVPKQFITSAHRDPNESFRTSPVIPPTRWMLFVVAGGVLILAGGFCAAIDGVAPSQHLAWASAYLVLVCGSAQIMLGGGENSSSTRHGRVRVLFGYEFTAFNVANAAVLVGTLLRLSIVLDVGSIFFLVALGLFAWATRGTVTHNRSVRFVYRAVILVLGVSVPVGVLLAH